MIEAKINDDEDERLKELIQYEILDTPQEQDFEDVVKLASYVCNASIGLVSFIDECRQWFKAKVGWEYEENPREISFCAHTIYIDLLMEVGDTLTDERFARNPLVMEGPKVRFYAGVPLVSPRGFKLGTLCVLDKKPRSLSKEQHFALDVLARYIVQMLELRLKQKNLAQTQKLHENLQEKMYLQQRVLTRTQRAAHIGMFELELSDQRLKVSEGFCHLFGLKVVHELSAEEYLSQIHPEDLRTYKQYFDQVLKGSAKKFSHDYRCRKKNTKQEIYVRTLGEVVRDAKGEPLQLIGIKQDITQQKWYEKQLEDQNAELLKVNQELDNFVYRVSHDLRAPISSLLGLAEIIAGEQDLSKVKELLLLVKKTLEKQDKFIKDILDYSRNARQEIRAELINFHEILEEMFAQYTMTPLYSQVEYSFDIDQEVPFETDAYRLKIILNNLISNAFKYLKQRKVNSFVHIAVKADATGARIEVKDNGNGIPKEYINRIFEMFYRATDQQPGSGLGLYIVKETIAKLKGKVSVESQQGEGTTFKVYIPNLAKANKSKKA